MGAVAVKQANDVILLVVEVSVGSTIEHHHSRLVLCIVEEVQFIVAALHMHNVLTMQDVVCYHPIYCLFHPQSVFIIHKLGVGVNAIVNDGKQDLSTKLPLKNVISQQHSTQGRSK